MTPEIAIVVALTRKGVMGKNNSLPWHLPEDLKRFKALTLGCPIIMGRKTFESIGRPLPGRKNIVITRNSDFSLPPNVFRANSLKDSLSIAGNCPKLCVIGGAAIIEEALSIAHTLHITWIEKEFDGDVVIQNPEEKIKSYKLIFEETHHEPFGHTFSDYKSA